VRLRARRPRSDFIAQPVECSRLHKRACLDAAMTSERSRQSAGVSPASSPARQTDVEHSAAIFQFNLPSDLREQFVAEVYAAYPRECCGLIEGVRRDGVIEVLRLHPTRNLATRADRFEIDPAEQFCLLRVLRDTERDIVGCYHSHPDGKAVPSAHDLAMAGEDNFIWLIAATRAGDGVELGAHLFHGGFFELISLGSSRAA
jgi:proteasome lid subunit RPN8/RPN11